jgi:hypothetical protein
MWPFKSRIPKLTDWDYDPVLGKTLIHKSGVFNYKDEEVLKVEFSSDFFSEDRAGKNKFIDFLFDWKKFQLANYLCVFLFFGGFLNMLWSIYPPKGYYEIDKELAIRNSRNFIFAYNIVSLFLAAILSYFAFLFTLL